MIVKATLTNGEDAFNFEGRLRGTLTVDAYGDFGNILATIKNQHGQQVDLFIPRGLARQLAEKILALDRK